MVKEFFKLKAGASPGPVLSPVSSLEATQLGVRGPAGMVEGEVQDPGPTPGQVSHPESSLEAHQVEVRGPPGRVEGEVQDPDPSPGQVSPSESSPLSSPLPPPIPPSYPDPPAAPISSHVQPPLSAELVEGGSSTFPSLDIRVRAEETDTVLHTEDRRSASTIVDVLTHFSRQKSGGFYEPPGFATTPYCILC